MITWAAAKLGASAVKEAVPVWVWKDALILVLLSVYSFYWYHLGTEHVQAKWDKAKIENEKKATTRVAKQEKIKEVVRIQYVDRIEKVYIAGKTILKEVPIVITEKADAECIVPNGFVRLWNDSNKGELSTSSPGVDEASSPVVLSDIAAQKATESTICKAAEEQVIALQEYALRLSKVH